MSKEKFYYIDENGNKKKYVGKIIYNSDGTYNGILTKNTRTVCTKNLTYHEEVPAVKGYYSYFSYVNNAGETIMYFDNVKKDEEGNPYFTYTEKNMFILNYNPEIEGVEEHFTYIDPETKEEKPYKGSIFYNSRTNTYTGIINK